MIAIPEPVVLETFHVLNDIVETKLIKIIKKEPGNVFADDETDYQTRRTSLGEQPVLRDLYLHIICRN